MRPNTAPITFNDFLQKEIFFTFFFIILSYFFNFLLLFSLFHIITLTPLARLQRSVLPLPFDILAYYFFFLCYFTIFQMINKLFKIKKKLEVETLRCDRKLARSCPNGN